MLYLLRLVSFWFRHSDFSISARPPQKTVQIGSKIMKINLLPKGTKIPKFEKRSSRNHVAKETSNQVNNRILNQIVTGKILRKVAEFGGI